MGYEYDAVGNRVGLTYPDSNRVEYAYDARNRLASATDWLSGVTAYTYDDAGNLIATLNPNGTSVGYSYDAAERLVGMRNSMPDDSVLANYVLTLNAVGNRIGLNKTELPIPMFSSNTQVAAYDDNNRMVTLDGSTVTHDANGNLTTKPGAMYRYDFENRLVGFALPTYRYDGLGYRLQRYRGNAWRRYTLAINGPLS